MLFLPHLCQPGAQLAIAKVDTRATNQAAGTAVICRPGESAEAMAAVAAEAAATVATQPLAAAGIPETAATTLDHQDMQAVDMVLALAVSARLRASATALECLVLQLAALVASVAQASDLDLVTSQEVSAVQVDSVVPKASLAPAMVAHLASVVPAMVAPLDSVAPATEAPLA